MSVAALCFKSRINSVLSVFKAFAFANYENHNFSFRTLLYLIVGKGSVTHI